MDFSSIKKTVGIFVLSMVAVSGFAQDIIARQAPSDKRLKDIRNVKLNNTAAISADLNNPAANIYTDWTDNLRSCTGAVPANYKIDLRGFCMPTPSRKINSNFGPRWGRRHHPCCFRWQGAYLQIQRRRLWLLHRDSSPQWS